MSAHTPGPWRVLPSFWTGGSSVAEGPGIFAIEDTMQTVICDRRTPWPEQADVMAANARLIAAAPDLLAFAQMVVRGEGDSVRTLIEAGRAAIAKATGEA